MRFSQSLKSTLILNNIERKSFKFKRIHLKGLSELKVTYPWSYSLHFLAYKMGSTIFSSVIAMRNRIKYMLQYLPHSKLSTNDALPHAFLMPWIMHLTIAASQRIMVHKWDIGFSF